MRKRIVLLGAGHAHLHTLARTASIVARGHDVVLIAPGPFWYSGLATGMLGGQYAAEDDQVDAAALVTRGGGMFVQDRVTGLDLAARTVLRADGEPVRFDALSLALGSVPAPLPGAGPDVFDVKPIPRLLALRQALEQRFAAGDAPRVVVAGGGMTAVELAANIAGLARRRGGRAVVTVLAAGLEALPGLPRCPANDALRALRRRGVTLRLDAQVASVGAGEAILADGERVPFDLLVNATGLHPSPVMRRLGLPVDDDGALRVDASLRSVADPSIHGGGDCVSVEGRRLPRAGVFAIRQAPVLFRNLLAAVEQGPRHVYRPQRSYLWIMNLGDGTGLGMRGSMHWQGRTALWLKDAIDRRFMRTYQRV